MTTLTQEVQARGYQYYDWNGSSGDGSVRTTEELVAQATSFAVKNGIDVDDSYISKKVEELVTLTKEVNQRTQDVVNTGENE